MSERARGRFSSGGGWNTAQVKHLLNINTVPDQTDKSKSNKDLVFRLELRLRGARYKQVISSDGEGWK